MLAFLIALYVVNYVDRQILAVLLEPIKRDLGASDTQMGLLSGPAFAVFYTLAAVATRFVLVEPPRGALEGLQVEAEIASTREVITFMLRQRTFRHLALASALYSFAAYGFTIWGSTFLVRVHHMTLGETGLAMGLVQGIGGVFAGDPLIRTR